jgi:predicted transcriptional regulator with HTH domain
MSVLLGTKLRKNLLAYSFSHPDESFYVRELSGLIQEDPGNVSRELRKLENEGIYNCRTRGNVKFYSLNKDYPVFRELEKIVLNTVNNESNSPNPKAKNKQRKKRSRS